MLSLLRRLPKRPPASAIPNELEHLTVEDERSTMEEVVGVLWAALAAFEDPRREWDRTLLVQVVEKRSVGRRERGQGQRGGSGELKRDFR